MKSVSFLSCLVSLLLSEPAAAYTIGTGFSENCHERITIAAWSRTLDRSTLGARPSPGGEEIGSLATYLLPESTVSASTGPTWQRDVLYQLVLGVQAPDTHGHSMLDLENARSIHANPEDQYTHSLRGRLDDGVEGDRIAIAGARSHIKASLERFRAELEKPSDQQFVRAQHYMDYYGMVGYEAWTPALHLGEALHTLQDSFAHSIRSDDLRRIRHVLNYEDAIYDHYDEPRDGLRHSASLDTCEEDTRLLVQAATEASTDLILAAQAGPDEVDALLDRWMGYEEGCSFSNDYCHSPWVAVARKAPTVPYLGCAMTPDATPWALPGLFLWLWLGRRRLHGV